MYAQLHMLSFYVSLVRCLSPAVLLLQPVSTEIQWAAECSLEYIRGSEFSARRKLADAYGAYGDRVSAMITTVWLRFTEGLRLTGKLRVCASESLLSLLLLLSCDGSVLSPTAPIVYHTC